MSNQLEAIGPNAADHYRRHTISKGMAVAMLVITVVAAALAIYFGHQAWQAGVNFSGNIPHLMASIPFDVTFLIGCTSAAVGILATAYSIYQYVQHKKLLPPNETEETKDLEGPQGVPEAEELQGPMDSQSYAQLASQVERKLAGSQEPTKSELRQLTDNYPLMLRVLPTIPERVVKLVVENLYENGRQTEFKNAVDRAVDAPMVHGEAALSSLIAILQEQETELLAMSIGQQLTQLSMSGDLKNRLLPGVKGFIWSVAVNSSQLSDDDTFRAATLNELDRRMVGSGLGRDKLQVARNQMYAAIKYLRTNHLFAAVGEIQELKGKLAEKR